MIDLALILAAGHGSRLRHHVPVPHKALISIGGEPLLTRTCRTLAGIGLREIVIVTGHSGAAVRAALAEVEGLQADLMFVENERWTQSNGLSVLAAAERLDRQYLLLMADHVFDPALLRDIVHVSPGDEDVILAVDRKLGSIYDMDYATKVQVEGEYIVDIGKELEEYNGVDAGLFACSGALVENLRSVEKSRGDCSVTDGVRSLAMHHRFRCFDIGDGWWQDIDTPGSLEHGARLLHKHQSENGAEASIAAAESASANATDTGEK